jgi:hypothetical protein
VRGKKEGPGRFVFNDGAIYDGDFKDDNMEGNGEYVWADGSKFKGQW